MDNTNKNVEVCGMNEILSGMLSKNAERNVKALIECEESFKTRCGEKGLEKGSKAFNDYRVEYNGFLKTKLELVAKGMEPGRASDRINYADPAKDKGAIRGAYRPDSAIWKAHEYIRLSRVKAFIKSKDESLLPEEVGMNQKTWAQIALALHAVPYSYRVATESGNLVHNKDTAEKYCTDYCAEITRARHELSKELEDAKKAADAEAEKAPKKKKAA